MELQMDMSYVFAVVITGIVVVFAGLILLIIFISAIGKLFEVLKNNKKSKELAAIKSEPVKAPLEIKSAQQPETVQEVIGETDDDEVIAVISAAVAMMAIADNKVYKVKSVKAVKSGVSRNAWAMAGLRENTNPF